MSEGQNAVKNALERPFPVTALRWRVGATSKDKTTGIALAYVDARDVMRRLDEAVGFENWQCRYSQASNIIICDIGLRLGGEWVWRSNGAGETQVEGEKGGCSDAFKRASVLWGCSRYLYSLPNVWIPLAQRGNSTFIPEESKQLLLSRLPAWATPEGYDEIMSKRSTT